MPLPLVLASSSLYRRNLLEKLELPFSCHSPDIDESPLPHEAPQEIAVRLAGEKARATAKHYPNHLIIGSDQVACLDNTLLGKPGTEPRAIEQLMLCNGRTVTFYTGLSLFNSNTGRQQNHCEPFQVTFRQLTEQQIRCYVKKEKPLDCAGSFKCEGLGIALFEKMAGDDPNSLIGLPLIQLNKMLSHEGVDVLTPTHFDVINRGRYDQST